MTTLTTADINSADVEELIAMVWGAVLDTEVVPTAPDDDTSGLMVASIELHGDWPGGFDVACEPALADLLARALFDIDGDVPEADRSDALGELTNMSGGNLKALLEGSNHLGLPRVLDGTPGFPASATPGRCWSFLAAGHRFVVRITEPAGVTAA